MIVNEENRMTENLQCRGTFFSENKIYNVMMGNEEKFHNASLNKRFLQS